MEQNRWHDRPLSAVSSVLLMAPAPHWPHMFLPKLSHVPWMFRVSPTRTLSFIFNYIILSWKKPVHSAAQDSVMSIWKQTVSPLHFRASELDEAGASINIKHALYALNITKAHIMINQHYIHVHTYLQDFHLKLNIRARPLFQCFWVFLFVPSFFARNNCHFYLPYPLPRYNSVESCVLCTSQCSPAKATLKSVLHITYVRMLLLLEPPRMGVGCATFMHDTCRFCWSGEKLVRKKWSFYRDTTVTTGSE